MPYHTQVYLAMEDSQESVLYYSFQTQITHRPRSSQRLGTVITKCASNI